MDDSFVFQGTPDPRHVDPWVVKLGAALAVFLLVAGLFGVWAATSEHRSFSRVQVANAAAARQASLQARQQTIAEARDAAAAVEMVTGTPTVVDSTAALQAQHEAFAALRAAKELHRTTGTFTAAGPAELSTKNVGALFVDGPSTMPEVISVSARPSAWAAAVMSTDGVCYYVHVVPTDDVHYGTGIDCTGADAMSAYGSEW
ncbi:MAG: hypothetical protein ABI828_04325 [Actinomycetota bacterium]